MYKTYLSLTNFCKLTMFLLFDRNYVWHLAWSSLLIYSFLFIFFIRSDQISRSVVSDSLRPHESQHARPPCPSPTPGVHWDSCPSSQWYHPAISSSVFPFSSCPQSLPASICFYAAVCLLWIKYYSWGQIWARDSLQDHSVFLIFILRTKIFNISNI